MKIQGLAIIFIIIILPITIIVGEYAATQIDIFKIEQLYDSRLITATHDALKAFQINTFNDATSDIADSKISSIEASANAFYNSMESSFGLQGYSKEDLKMYVPALVYTMYDGYYIYSPYTNVAEIATHTGEGTEDDAEANGLRINLDSTNIDYGFKPYVYYSCRYVKKDGFDNIDVIINYSLDNYITVQGTIDNQIFYKSGYLVTLANSKNDEGLWLQDTDADGTAEEYYYSGKQILPELSQRDYLIDVGLNGDIIKRQYKYIKLNGTKYYLNEKDDNGDGTIDEYIFYLLGKNRIKQVTKTNNPVAYEEYVKNINNNTSAINYYKSAYDFTKWVNENLGRLKTQHAVTGVRNSGEGPIFQNKQIEYSSSNFNLHRKEVIRHSIESNLSTAIANFNNYTNADPSANFQMPKLKETEWEMLQNEVAIISFLQGMNMGGKIYNGYTVVTNDKTEEVVKEERIYITADDNGDSLADYYHKINDKHLTEDDLGYLPVSGVLDLDFEIRKDALTGMKYVNKTQLGCYTSVVGQENVDTKYDSIYEYLQKLSNGDTVTEQVKQLYYTALARERWGMYKIENPSSIVKILTDMELDDSINEEIPEEDIEDKEPFISVVVTIEPNNYISNTQKPTVKANITINCETPITSAKYILTKSSTEPTEGWSNIPISADRASAQLEYSKQILEDGIWYLFVKASSGTVEKTTRRPFVIKEQNEPPEIIIKDVDQMNADGSYVIPANGTPATIAKQIFAKDYFGSQVATLKSIYSTSPTIPDDSADWQNALLESVIVKHVSEPGNYYLHVVAIDSAGNKKIETRPYLVKKEATYEIEIIDEDGISSTYNIEKNKIVTMNKSISLTASDGNTENLTIEYAIVKGNTGIPTDWTTYNTGDIITKKVSYNNHGYYYLHVRVLDDEGNVLADKVKCYIFNGAHIYV